jgi:hypothetical protein
MNTLRPAEESWVEEGKDGQMKNHEDVRNVKWAKTI